MAHSLPGAHLMCERTLIWAPPPSGLRSGSSCRFDNHSAWASCGDTPALILCCTFAWTMLFSDCA